MSVQERTSPKREPEFDLDSEQEVDLGRLWRAVVTRWWLPLVGAIAGIALGYIVALGGTQVYKAQALLYLGQPLSPGGGAILSLATNPTTVSQIVRSEAALKSAAASAGLRVGSLRGNVSSTAVTGATALKAQTPLVAITVKGRSLHKVQDAANALANLVVARTSGYVEVKLHAFDSQLAGINRELASIDTRLTVLNEAIKHSSSLGLTPLNQLVLISQIDNAEQRRGQLLDEQSQVQQLQSLAQSVELGRVVEPAVAVPSTARSKRNSALVGLFIGLLLGVIAAIAWDPVAGRLNRRAER
jgi:uncharacterized protein involved in exopolysaccharide biosynthesis